MLTNGPPPKAPPGCSLLGRDVGGALCSGKLHEYDVQMYAKLDGTPVRNAPMEKTLICEGHYPDKDDPTFSSCTCRLCVDGRG